VKNEGISINMLQFIHEHHVLSMATLGENGLSSCSLFYLFIEDEKCFIFASDEATEHIKNIQQNPSVSAAIYNETTEINEIKGLQIRGTVSKAEAKYEELYLLKYPYAKAVDNKTLWKLGATALKYTDNSVSFGTKEVWNY
jgi:uncharacterized protein